MLTFPVYAIVRRTVPPPVPRPVREVGSLASRAGPPRSPSRRFLPPTPGVAEPYRLTPQMALRIAILGVVVLAVFAVLFLRLWALQVLSGADYLMPPRTTSCGRFGFPRRAARSSTGTAPCSSATSPARRCRSGPPTCRRQARRDRVLKRLAGVLDVNVYWLIHQVEKRARDPLTPVTVKRGIHDSQVMYLEERQDEFPGVKVAETFLRDYPHRALAAHVLGHVGEVTERQIEDNQQLRPGDEVGQGGVEATYDRFLRGVPGEAGSRRLARSPDRALHGDGALAARKRPPADDRPAAPAGGGERAALRDQDRPGEQGMGRERRRHRRDGPAKRRDPRAGVEPDLQAERLRRAPTPRSSRRSSTRG